MRRFRLPLAKIVLALSGAAFLAQIDICPGVGALLRLYDRV